MQVVTLATNAAQGSEDTATALVSHDDATIDKVLELSVRFVMDVLVHSWDVGEVSMWVTLIKSLLTADPAGLRRCKWLVNMFMEDVVVERENTDSCSRVKIEAHAGGDNRGQAASQETAHHDDVVMRTHWLRWAVLHCRTQDARVQLVGMLVQACTQLSAVEREALGASAGPVPHCAPQMVSPHGEARPDRNQVYVPLYGDRPLLTDVPFKRAYPGGTDVSLPPPHDYLPFPRALTTVGMLMDKVLDMLPEVPEHWRHFAQYFKLLADLAEVSAHVCILWAHRRSFTCTLGA
jgi:hypothetical protein